ncbi:non-canonical purine NTP pyrophosphatase, RdgB/HAM1 family [Treponema primitia ZAS-2]|uniref:dITP/XTP pyrophosphatase n=1 Tax=Treponema primitia (strain ATCC BAA-887 / DSM 12427 / ZAS-2) TaxID=545694 RepID=F5YNS4_TREPZ|nr:RdgB/HAM1 family non-canonical purine NTP pyrophosphatase [Treponema primitia]AEF84397.1 non-canonical purine NTP pyrophosphatase, RdgB/HAM1 family [Treponema primitia ZAS-2]
MTIWFATGNAHKKGELSAILPGHTIRIPADLGIPFDPDETGSTFAENALIKATALYTLVSARFPGEPVLADDSGLCVDALDGRPGIYSARYGSTGDKKLEAHERNALLLQELGDNPRRTARFVCSMALILGPDRFFIAQETLEGELIREGRGSAGFGYDPILYIPSYSRTVAELSEEEKNLISHRGKAGRAIAKFLN